MFEGPDRSGKSTQVKLLASWLRKKHFKPLITREPGGARISEAIRRILLEPKNRINSLTEILLYEAARSQHTADVILPALKAGRIVISDRFAMSTTAYQGYGRKIPIKTVETLNKIATFGLDPDITIVLNIPDSIFNERERQTLSAAEGRALKLSGPDRMERASSNFRKRVNKAYKMLSRRPGIIRINATEPIEAIQARLRAAIAKKLKMYPERSRRIK